MSVSTSREPAKIAGMFDAIAGNYDFLNHLLSAGIDKRWRRKAIRSLGLTGREHVLDLCTGTADLAIAAVDATPGAKHVLGVDFAGEMLRVGLDKTRTRALDRRVALVRGDAANIPAATQSVDAVTIAFGIRNVQDTQRACDEIFRVLKPGGRFLCLEFSKVLVPVLDKLYDAYSFKVLPKMGERIAGDADSYRYLAESIRMHPDQETLKQMMLDAGLERVEYFNLCAGVVALHRGYRF